MSNGIIHRNVKYPRALRVAVLAAERKKGATAASVAKAFNISRSTVSSWKAQAGKTKPTKALKRHFASLAIQKAYNTPTTEVVNGKTVITYQGKIYSA